MLFITKVFVFFCRINKEGRKWNFYTKSDFNSWCNLFALFVIVILCLYEFSWIEWVSFNWLNPFPLSNKHILISVFELFQKWEETCETAIRYWRCQKSWKSSWTIQGLVLFSSTCWTFHHLHIVSLKKRIFSDL